MKTEPKARLNVMLASYDVSELRVQKRYLEEGSAFIKCKCYSNGAALLDELKHRNHFDVVVLSGRLEDMEEMQFIAKLRLREPKPMLVLFGENCHGKNTAACLRADGHCYIMKQTGLADLLSELCRIPGRRVTLTDTLCRRLFADWGIRKHDLRCGYLMDALRVACGTDEKLAVRKGILSAVSDEHKVSVSAVESGIRRMVDELEEKQTVGWREFKRTAGFGDSRPTTGKLVYATKEHLLMCGFE